MDSTERVQRIVALGGGGFSEEANNPALDDYILALTGKERPGVCFLATASGDAAAYIVNFYDSFPPSRAQASHLSFFRPRDSAFSPSLRDLRSVLLDRDIVYVGGGNTAAMLSVWRAFGFDAALREAYDAGVLLCGISAGALCWFEGGVTDSFGPPPVAWSGGLGFIQGSFSPHYDEGEERRRVFQHAVAQGALTEGVACDNGVAVLYKAGQLVEAVSSRPNARAWRLERQGVGCKESEIMPRLLQGTR